MEEEPLSKSQLEDLTYPYPRLKDFTLGDNLPALDFPPDKHITKTPKVDLGTLDVLPLELLQDLLFQIDLRTLAKFRRINRRAVEVVEAIPQHKAVTTHAPNVIHGILGIETGQWISCQNVYEKLCAPDCERCGDFAGYLYILTCERVCFLCFSEDKTYLPLRHSHAIRKFGINHQILSTLPRMTSIPGTYSPNERKRHERPALVDSESAYRAGITFHGSSIAMKQYVSNTLAQKLQDFNRRASQATAEESGSSTHRLRRPQTKEPFDGRSRNPMRFMAIVRMAVLKKVSQELEWGFHCIGCEKCYHNRIFHFGRKFTVASFSEHLRQCGKIRNGKHFLQQV
ncbi:hypothetical protein GQ44DRAFT_739461 [Phaeosphaeriaceae sp. PMI808]|nr:hypothetical protein GQ44DRAFT_739461 [Phaeosphaeriaceae sp. PMI808]